MMMTVLFLVDTASLSDLSAAASTHESTSTTDSCAACKSPMIHHSIGCVLLHTSVQ